MVILSAFSAPKKPKLRCKQKSSMSLNRLRPIANPKTILKPRGGRKNPRMIPRKRRRGRFSKDAQLSNQQIWGSLRSNTLKNLASRPWTGALSANYLSQRPKISRHHHPLWTWKLSHHRLNSKSYSRGWTSQTLVTRNTWVRVWRIKESLWSWQLHWYQTRRLKSSSARHLNSRARKSMKNSLKRRFRMLSVALKHAILSCIKMNLIWGKAAISRSNRQAKTYHRSALLA